MIHVPRDLSKTPKSGTIYPRAIVRDHFGGTTDVLTAPPFTVPPPSFSLLFVCGVSSTGLSDGHTQAFFPVCCFPNTHSKKGPLVAPCRGSHHQMAWIGGWCSLFFESKALHTPTCETWLSLAEDVFLQQPPNIATRPTKPTSPPINVPLDGLRIFHQ